MICDGLYILDRLVLLSNLEHFSISLHDISQFLHSICSDGYGTALAQVLSQAADRSLERNASRWRRE